MTPEFITAIAALVAAFGAIIAAVLAYLARRGVSKAEAEIVATQDGIYELGARLDGRLSQLLEARTISAHAEGVAQGEQDERDRQAQ